MIQHVNFKVAREDVEECVSFYELLGFKAVSPPESLAARAVWLQNGATQIHLQYAEADGSASAVRPSGAGEAEVLAGVEGFGHVAIVVSEYAAAIGALGRIGVPVDERTPHWGSPRCYVRDPVGNRLELMEFAP